MPAHAVYTVFFQCLGLALFCGGLLWTHAKEERAVGFTLALISLLLAAAIAGMAVVKLGWVVL